MALIENSVRFCVFCHQGDTNSIKFLCEFTKFQLFLKLLGRFNGDNDAKLEKLMKANHLNELLLSDKLGCCERCSVMVNEFCDIYHQYKYFEMQLEFKLDKFVKVIKLNDKVPSTDLQVTKAVQTDSITKDRDNENANVIGEFRHCFVKQCHQRLTKCQPRILIGRNHATLANTAQTLQQPPTSGVHQFSKLDCQQIRSTENGMAKFYEPFVASDLQEINSQSCASNNPKMILKPSGDVDCDDDGINEESNELDDYDSASSYDDETGPTNTGQFFEDDIQEESNTVSVQNINNLMDSPIQTKLELPDIPTQEGSNLETTKQPCPQPASSIIIENVFSTLPLPLSKILSKTSLCKICKKHFISEDWLNKHIQKDHTETPSKIQEPPNIVTEQAVQNKTQSFIEECLKNADIKPITTTHSQKRYSLRQRKSTSLSLNLADIDSDHDNDNDMEYTKEQSDSRSNTSDSEEDVKNIIKKSIKVEPVKTTKIRKPNNIRDRTEYTNCKICNKKTTRKILKSHLKTWHDKTNLNANQIIKCEAENCTAYFLTREQLLFHKRYEHSNIVRCHICQKTFPFKLLLNQHLRFDHQRPSSNPMKYLEDSKSTEFKCNFCEFLTTSPTKLAIHETEHALPLSSDDPLNKNLLSCPRCPYKYAKRMQRRYVVHHLRKHLSYLTGESTEACEMCSKGKAFVENTKQHFDLHHNTDLIEDPTNIFKCDECPSYYLKSFQLHRHKIRIHPIKTCEICEKTFKSRHQLLSHMNIMHKDYQLNPSLPVPCDWPNCVKRFGTEAELEYHKIYTHKRNPEEKKGSVICEICGRGFRSTGILKVHMSKIHGEKNWVCSDCGRRFTVKKAFERHMEYHKGPDGWKFECTVCGKKCQDKWKLTSHMNTHTKEKPYICQFCGEKYAHRHNWRNHLKVKHMDEEGVEEIVIGKSSQRKGDYLSRKGTKKGDCIMASSSK